MSWKILYENSEPRDGDLPPEVFARAMTLYDAEIASVDAELDRLFQALEARGWLDSTIVTFTADHGECFENGYFFEHSPCLFDGAMRVPLIMRYPPAVPAGQRIERQVDLLDVAPTFGEMTGVEMPEAFLGRPLFGGAEGDDESYAFLQHPFQDDGSLAAHRKRQARLSSVAGEPARAPLEGVEQVGLRSSRWKYLRAGADEELYDLVEDPGERRNLAAERSQEVRELRAAVSRWLRDHPLRLPDTDELDDELRETLESLGYL